MAFFKKNSPLDDFFPDRTYKGNPLNPIDEILIYLFQH